MKRVADRHPAFIGLSYGRSIEARRKGTKMRRIVLGLAVAALVAGCGSGGSRPTAKPATGPVFTTASDHVDNQWFPLKPGTTYVYRGVKDGKPSRDVVTVARRTKLVRGVRCAVVRDLLYQEGHVGERTTDWYAQDAAGNVWYFGEATAELNANGSVKSTEGSWQAGRNGAREGVYMPAHPRVGQSGRQEYYRGHAEDHFQVLSVSARVTTPAASSRRALLTKEWTPLEPGVIDHKLYVRGVGTVREEAVKGPLERNVLVKLRAR
jgi:hypothetical protein